MKPVSRKAGTLRNMVFEYAMMALMIVRGIVLPPLAARYIDHNLLGAWFASGNIMQWLMVSEGGAWLFLRQRAAVEFGRGDHTALAAVIGSSGIIIVSLGTVTVLLSLSIAPLVPGWLHVDARLSGELVMAFSLTAMGMGLGFLASIPRAVGHGLQRQVAVNTSLLVAESTSLAASIVLLMNGYGLLSLGVGPLIRELLHNLLNWPILVRMLHGLHIRPVVSRAYIKSMTGQMSWTFVNNLSGVMRRNVDALIVSQVFGNSAVLLVEWTKRAWEIFASVVTRASTSFTPALAHLYGEADLPKFRTISAQLFAVIAVALGIALAVGLALNQPFVGLWVGTQFYAGNQYNLVLGLAMVASAIGFTLLEVLFATGNIRRPAIAQLLQTVARLGVLFALVPMVGLLSIPLSMLITESLGILYLSLEWQRTLKVPGRDMLKQLLLMGRTLLVALVLALAWMALPHPVSWPGLVLHGVLFGTALVLAFYLVEPFVRFRINGLLILFWQYGRAKW